MNGDGMGNRRGDGAAPDESWTQMETAEPDAVEALPIRHGMVLGGRYAIEKIIGRGGSGVVVRAHDRDLQAAVAIKIVRADLAGQRAWAERLAREVRLARQIHHAHVCRVFDFEQADGRAFLVMELAEGGTLRAELRSDAGAARPFAARIADARAVASALDAIHRAGIVHRDLSSQNLLRMGDGRVVVSDFGLAVDVSDSTSSVHGGTVPYMAPEVVRGDRATFASDVWSLGIVIHEIIFGALPRWSAVEGGPMPEPALGRRLTEEERAVLETCRACTARDPARRIARAADAERMLGDRPRWRPQAGRRAVMIAGAVAVAALATVAMSARHKARDAAARTAAATQQSAAAQSPLIVPTGEPADWTDVSTVLAEVPERITCTRLLPDQRTIRFVWGTPPRAEDIDVITRKRVRSPLVPAAYAEGCPDLSPDGKRLVFQGHTSEGRAFAFLSEHPDGRDATPVVQTAQPTMSSEPTWLANTEAFSYDIDSKHMGAFAVEEGRLTVLPDPTGRPFVTSFRSVADGLVFVTAVVDAPETEFVGFSWPLLREKVRFRCSGFAFDLAASSGSTVYLATRATPADAPVMVRLDYESRVARRLGRVRDQLIRDPRPIPGGDLVFLSAHYGADLFLQAPDGRVVRVTNGGRTYAAAHCGDDFVVQRERDGTSVIERLNRTGQRLSVVGDGTEGGSPGCSPDGSTVFYVDRSSHSIARCHRRDCRTMARVDAQRLAVSPDGRRLVITTLEREGIGVWVVDSDTGEARYLSQTETFCGAGWASPDTVWISRRRGGNVVWVGVDANSGRETGTSVRGSHDCSDAKPDPASPIDPDIRIVYDQRSQLRLLDRRFLERN